MAKKPQSKKSKCEKAKSKSQETKSGNETASWSTDDVYNLLKAVNERTLARMEQQVKDVNEITLARMEQLMKDINGITLKRMEEQDARTLDLLQAVSDLLNARTAR